MLLNPERWCRQGLPQHTGRVGPFFSAIGPGDAVTLANPSRAAQGDRVTHPLYDVERTTEP